LLVPLALYLALIISHGKELPTTKGILFNFERQILIAEKFINAQFLIPFPGYLHELDSQFLNISAKIEQLWAVPNEGCKFFKDQTGEFSAESLSWLVKYVNAEHTLAKEDLKNMRTEIHEMLQSNEATENFREKRGVAIALGAVALFGAGVGIGTQMSCALKGLFGTCSDFDRENKENIAIAMSNIEMLNDALIEIKSNTNNKMYLIASELYDIKRIQKQIIDTQNSNWEQVKDELEIIQNNTFYMVDCQRSLYNREHILNQALIISNTLNALLQNIKAFRVALFAYRINLLNSLGPMLDNYIPLSLLPKKSLRRILDRLMIEQVQSGERLSLAIPVSQILAYYETKLLTGVVTTEFGLIFSISVPMSSRETVMNVFEAIPIPMPEAKGKNAVLWKTETEFIAISENKNFIALLDRKDLDKCIGSKRIAICHEMFATDTSKRSCLAALYFKTTLDAIETCPIRSIKLPLTEKAKKLG
jgi:hypothetical protein